MSSLRCDMTTETEKDHRLFFTLSFHFLGFRQYFLLQIFLKGDDPFQQGRVAGGKYLCSQNTRIAGSIQGDRGYRHYFGHLQDGEYAVPAVYRIGRFDRHPGVQLHDLTFICIDLC